MKIGITKEEVVDAMETLWKMERELARLDLGIKIGLYFNCNKEFGQLIDSTRNMIDKFEKETAGKFKN